ncbi:unnamed protein product [Vicia faba]|uniref:Uncharacterized protein n=1 Tax=Vicia faba TaxID=3906 RepID=A0AAV0ZHP1_VICFA|nr:unnamed protein product [Vicia faba]
MITPNLISTKEPKFAPEVLKGKLGCVSLTEADVVSTMNVQRVAKGAPFFARHIVVGNVARLQGALKTLKKATQCGIRLLRRRLVQGFTEEQKNTCEKTIEKFPV